MNVSTRHPERKKLPHERPAWVPDSSRYFITINVKARDINTLCVPGVADRLLESVPAYEQRMAWYVYAMMIMPDHIHLVASFSREPGLRNTIQSWKRYFARSLGIVWQSDFFEHRLRNEAEFDEKLGYVLHNPMRKKLADRLSAWPHWFARGDWRHLG
jgi:REP element-mobilizing transposase RayT